MNHIILSLILLLLSAMHVATAADLPSLLQSKGTQLFQQAGATGGDARSTYIRFVDLVARPSTGRVLSHQHSYAERGNPHTYHG